MKKFFVTIFIPLLYFFILACFLTYPLVRHMTDRITGLGDELLIIWIQNWVIHAFSTNIFGLFQGNIFYPYHNSLAYSETFITTSLISWIPYLLVKQPVITLNFTLFTSTWLFGFSLFMLCYYLTKKTAPSLVVGTIAVCSPAVLDKSVHLQVLSIYFVMFALLFYLIFLQRQQFRYYLLFLLFLLLQIYNSFLPGYFILCSIAIITFFYRYYKKISLMLFLNKWIGISTALCFLLCLPAVLPYYAVSKEFHFVRDIRETIHLGLQPEDLLYANDYTRLSPFLTQNLKVLHEHAIVGETKNGYLGIVFSLLSLIAIVYGFRKWRRRNPVLNSFLVISLFGLIMSFGPFLHIARQTIHKPFPIPLPYAIFYALAPGFKGFRNSARWEMLFIIGISVVMTFMLTDFLKNKHRLLATGILFVLLTGVLLEYNFPRHLVNVPEIPAVNRWLSTTPEKSVVVELPVYVWYMHPYATDELFRDYYSVSNFRPLVNGASGYSPIPWEGNVKQLMIEFPYEPSYTRMRRMGVNYIVFHKKEFDRLHENNFTIDAKLIDNGETLLEDLMHNRNVTFIKRFSDDYVFRLNYD